MVNGSASVYNAVWTVSLLRQRTTGTIQEDTSRQLHHPKVRVCVCVCVGVGVGEGRMVEWIGDRTCMMLVSCQQLLTNPPPCPFASLPQ